MPSNCAKIGSVGFFNGLPVYFCIFQRKYGNYMYIDSTLCPEVNWQRNRKANNQFCEDLGSLFNKLLSG